MNQISDDAFEYKGTRFHLRAFTDPLNLEKPVFVLEEGAKNQHSLGSNRVELAKELASSINRKPEEITWLEQSPDGSLKQIEFVYTHTDTIYPNKSTLSPEEIQSVEEGDIKSDQVRRYNTRESEVSRVDFQAKVGDALVPYETRQNQAFHRMEALTNKGEHRQEYEAELARNPPNEYAPDL